MSHGASAGAWSEPDDARVEHEDFRRRRRGPRASGEPAKGGARALGSPGAKLLMARAKGRASGRSFAAAATASVDGRMQRRHSSPRQRTVHDEMTDVPVSSDDSSDDDEIYSRASRKSRATVHREANGIWVSSDDESDDQASTPQRWRSRRPRHASSFRVPEAHFFSDMDARPRSSSSSSSAPTPSDPSSAQYHRPQEPRAAQNSCWQQDNNEEGRYARSGSSEGYISGTSSPHQPRPHVQQALNPSPSASSHTSRYWSSSSSETSSSHGHEPSTLRHRRGPMSSTFGAHPAAHLGAQPANGYESLESVSLASTSVSEANGYMSAASNDRRSVQRAKAMRTYRSSGLCQGTSTASWAPGQTYGHSALTQEPVPAPAPALMQTPSHAYPVEDGSGTLWANSAASAPTGTGVLPPQTQSAAVSAAIQLHAVQFWDPDGTRALVADRGTIGGGIAAGLGLIGAGMWVWGLGILLVTVLAASYVSTVYRLSKWRASSGIEQQALFNDMYEIVEQACTDTRVTLASGEMRPRLLCAGELGTALERHFPGLAQDIKLRFWTEACVHFRLTLRSGCHHLGQGKLHPRHLTTSTLGAMTKHLPTGVCPSCDNKIAIEARFPLKCS